MNSEKEALANIWTIWKYKKLYSKDHHLLNKQLAFSSSNNKLWGGSLKIRLIRMP